ncbi:MAG: formylglycine-generating enzyme family protein [Desulfosalsimonadaceae bacterium]
MKQTRFVCLALLPAIFFLLVCCRAGAGEKSFTNEVGMEFVRIEPGAFMMGSPHKERLRNKSEMRHRAVISESFYMQTTEVTIGQWQAVMGKKWLFPRKGPKNRPVTKVSWHDCQDFIKELNQQSPHTYRLPTEVEWEYACRAGTQTAYSWGDEIDCTKAMYENSPLKKSECVETVKSMGLEPGVPAPVKSYSPNPWGLYDMHGNVWEWCGNCFDRNPHHGEKKTAYCSRRVRRGGSWYSSPYSLRSANRAYAHPAAKFKTTGFRLVREAP